MDRCGKTWLFLAGVNLWFIAAGCAPDGPLGRSLRPDQPKAPPLATLGLPTYRSGIAVEVGTVGDGEPARPLPSPPGQPVSVNPQSVTNPLNSQQSGAQARKDRIAHQETGKDVKPVLFFDEKDDKLPPPAIFKPVNFNFDDVEIRKVLDILSKEGSLNLLVSPNVTGRLTANLKGMSLDDALASILKLSDLVAVREKGLLYIYTAEEKLPIRIYHLQYARTQDLEKMIKPLLSLKGKITVTPASAVGISSPSPIGGSAPPGGGGGAPAPAGGGAAGGGGSASGGDSLAINGAMIVQDFENVLTGVDRVVAELDVQPPQVLIEAVILNLSLNKGQELGINFAVLNSAGQLLSVVGNGALLNSAVGFLPALAQATGNVSAGFTSNQFLLGNGGPLAPPASVQPGFANNVNGLNIGGANRNVAAFILALDSIGSMEVLATPRLLVLNRQLAEIKLSQQLGYSTFSQSAISTIQNVQFLDVGTQLRVRPFISHDGMVRMEIHPERSSGSVVNNIPQTATAGVTSNVIVPDGATIVIGGLMENIPQVTETGVPYLSRIPYFGALFRDRQVSTTRNELIVLLTPRIWNPRDPQGLNTSGRPPVPVTPLPIPPDPSLFP